MSTAPTYGQPEFLGAWGEAWSCGDPQSLLPFYAPDAEYRDVGSDMTFQGHDEIGRFYRFMLRFAPDSRIEFDHGVGDRTGFAAHWIWSGSAAGPLRLPGRNELVEASGKHFSVPGIAYCALAGDGTIASHHDYYDMRAVLLAIIA